MLAVLIYTVCTYGKPLDNVFNYTIGYSSFYMLFKSGFRLLNVFDLILFAYNSFCPFLLIESLLDFFNANKVMKN